MISQFFEANKIVILFFYPLIFFLMGFGIFLKNRRHSQFYLAKSLQYMALFGIVHSFADWGKVFIPLQTSYLDKSTILTLESIQMILESLSFSFLLHFGIHLLQRSTNLNKKFLIISPIVFSTWIVCFFVLKQTFFMSQNAENWLLISGFWAKILIALPGGILSSIAVYIQHKQFKTFEVVSMNLTLLLASLSILLYTFTTGCISPYVPVFHGFWLSYDQFEKFTGVPIEIFRGFSGVTISFFILRILKFVDIEYQQYFYQAKRNNVVMEERTRIARDLHDGMIQSIYATGLRLEGIRYMLNNERYDITHSQTVLHQSITKLNDLIVEIRRYIKELQLPIDKTSKLREELIKLIDDMNYSKSLSIEFEYRYIGDEPALSITVQVFYIVKEALSNVLKHSQATKAWISIFQNETDFVVEIKDNGEGLKRENLLIDQVNVGMAKQGVRNMEYRANAIGGNFTIHSSENGTVIQIRIKLSKLKGDQEDGKNSIDDC